MSEATGALSLADVVAIDFHTHAEMSNSGSDSLPEPLREADAIRLLGLSAA